LYNNGNSSKTATPKSSVAKRRVQNWKTSGQFLVTNYDHYLFLHMSMTLHKGEMTLHKGGTEGDVDQGRGKAGGIVPIFG
jgi:hypothetical protein